MPHSLEPLKSMWRELSGQYLLSSTFPEVGVVQVAHSSFRRVSVKYKGDKHEYGGIIEAPLVMLSLLHKIIK